MNTWCFNFKARFAPKVEAGTKLQTVRANRKDGRVPVVGDIAKLYTGLRSKQTRLLRPPTKIVAVQPIATIGPVVYLDGHRLSRGELVNFAQRDGFDDEPFADCAMLEFLAPGDENFYGFVVYWDPLMVDRRDV